jgi:serine/threonine protein phosphatase 1
MGAFSVGPMENAIWGRNRVNGVNYGPVAGVRAVVVGHNVVPDIQVIDNVHHIDTGAWFRGGRVEKRFAILDAATLQLAEKN